MQYSDVAVIGAGFGGLGCALELAHRDVDVVVFERLTYPGGCASTFARRGWRFESGATLFCGFERGQLFRDWIDRFDLDVQFDPMDPVVDFRSEDARIRVPADRQRFIERWCQIAGERAGQVRRFFGLQRRVADALWELFDDPKLLPPLNAGNLMRHIGRAPQYLPLMRLVGRPVTRALARYGLEGWRPLRNYLDAVCQITVQASADEAEAPFAMAAMDYFFRGAGHVHGGIGELAHALADQIEQLGGQVRFADQVQGIRRHQQGWVVDSRRSEIRADQVVANLLPHNVVELLDEDVDADDSLPRLTRQVETGWGAAMLYLGLAPAKIDIDEAYHIEMIGDPQDDCTEGNHLFCSVSAADETGRSPDGQRVATVSTHVDMQQLRGGDETQRAGYIDAIHQRMWKTLRQRAPEIADAVVFDMTASPRTFERFTNRRHGYVGGIPRRVGLHNYRRMGPQSVADGLYLVGDTVFPGQSTLAVALGGLKVAERIWQDER